MRRSPSGRACHFRTIDEYWYVLSGEGEIWRSAPDGHESITRLIRGVCVDIPLGTAFQYRCTGNVPLVFTCTALPPWPGDRRGRDRGRALGTRATRLRSYWRWLGHRLRLSQPGRVLFTGALLVGGAEMVVERVHGDREGGAPLVVLALLFVGVVTLDAVGQGVVAVVRRLISEGGLRRHS